MKTKKQSKIRNLRLSITDWLRSAIKMLRNKFATTGKSYEPFPNEAPH